MSKTIYEVNKTYKNTTDYKNTIEERRAGDLNNEIEEGDQERRKKKSKINENSSHILWLIKPYLCEQFSDLSNQMRKLVNEIEVKVSIREKERGSVDARDKESVDAKR